jgi:phosphoserine phosphatase
MRNDGAKCVLVSGGFTYFTSRVAELAGFHSDRANTLIMEDGKLTGEVGQPILGREAKLVALDEEADSIGVSAADAIAMGDGANDLAMIEAAGMGLAFRAKPIVAEQADVAIRGKSLIPALFYQGYKEDEFATDESA